MITGRSCTQSLKRTAQNQVSELFGLLQVNTHEAEVLITEAEDLRIFGHVVLDVRVKPKGLDLLRLAGRSMGHKPLPLDVSRWDELMLCRHTIDS